MKTPSREGTSPADEAPYLDSSAFAKLYVPEPESERLDAFLTGRRGLMISELAITVALRTLDALHIALALSDAATHVVTFDRRMREAALHAGLRVVEI